MKLLDELAVRQRFGMKPGLDSMRQSCAALGNPERSLRGVVHVAGTNGKGAVCAMLDACLRASGFRVGRYTSPHLVAINERFFLDGAPVDDAVLDSAVEDMRRESRDAIMESVTYFEYLTLVAFELYSKAKPDYTILETGLGGRLDATNVCTPVLTIITRIGLDHCDWLGDTVEKIAAEKAGIIKRGVPIVFGANLPAVRSVFEARAREMGAPFYYAPDVSNESEIPCDFSLAGSFNRENAITALAALKVMGAGGSRVSSLSREAIASGLSRVVWPGRFQRIGDFIVDGAHNPPAAKALADALTDAGFGLKSLNLICGFCGDKDVAEVLALLAPFIARGFAVKTNNPRSLEAAETAKKMSEVGIKSTACGSLSEAIERAQGLTLVAGSLFLAGEALVALGAAPFALSSRFDAAERLKV